MPHPLRPTILLAALLSAACATSGSSARSTQPASSTSTERPEHTVRAPTPPTPAWVQRISAERVHRTVETLAAFGTRHTLSDTTSTTRGIGAARAWIKAQFDAIAQASGRTGDEAMQISFDSHLAPPQERVPRATEVVNVIALIPGAMPEARARRYYVLGHYDSRVTDVMNATSDAPGANDDASGVAVLMELARVLSTERLDATVVLMATAGEEQGLIGATMHAANAKEQGVRVAGVLNDDIVGDPTGVDGTPHKDVIRVFSEGLPANATPEDLKRIRQLGAESDSPSRQLARFTAEVAQQHRTTVQPKLVFRPDRYLRGGDHIPFNEQGFPAIRFTVLEEHFDRQHADLSTKDGQPYGDVPRFVDGDYLADVTRLNGLVLAELADAPSPPAEARVIASALENGTTLRWTASPEPDVAGYEVVWRSTLSPVWDSVRDVGAATEANLPQNKDDVVFGVRAYDRDGHRSPVSFCTAAKK